MLFSKSYTLVAFPALALSWEIGVFSTSTTCTLGYAPDSSRKRGGGVTSECQSIGINSINAVLVKDWDDNCIIRAWPRMPSGPGCEGDPTIEFGDGQENSGSPEYRCVIWRDFPDGFTFIYSCSLLDFGRRSMVTDGYEGL